MTFLSCDWGTSTFRLRVVDAISGSILSQIITDDGIAHTFDCWKQTNNNEESRSAFFQSYLLKKVKELTGITREPLSNTPVIISGMASSNIGMIELPYKNLPFNCNGSDLTRHVILSEDTGYKIIIVSGARSDVDVMRGEETILVGCDVTDDEHQHLFIFPGTHCKHIVVKNGAAQKVTTYMTGELFDLLSARSILSASVQKNYEQEAAHEEYFAKGVKEGLTLNLLNSIFHVRINRLFNKATPHENYYFLSGLLIGHELKDVSENEPGQVTLVCNEALKGPYLQALSMLNLSTDVYYKNADDALIKAHCKIIRNMGLI